jgi:hypothetical protein
MRRHLFFTALILVGSVSLAQDPLSLNEDCIVTVGNQTAIVRPDGTFLIQNITVFQSRVTGVAPQLYRVRATCLRGGVMETGQSEFFSLTPGQTSIIADVRPSEIDPIPVRVSVTAPTNFVPLGSSVQLTVLATLPDGSTENVTPRSAGTTYLSTNPNLLTIGNDGLVTGANTTITPQTGTIVVLNEGNVASINFNAVGPSNDFDNDGMPNDFEELFGLNPFQNDAGGDLDGDGLTNLQEFELGTLPNNADTDLDGIPDGLDGDPLRPESGPPTVALLSPAGDTTLVEGETITFAVEARDDGLLTGVEFLVNGVSFGSAEEAPFELTFTVPFSATFVELDAAATDSVGNVGRPEAPLSLTVAPDSLTTVEGVVVEDGQGTSVADADVALKLHGLRGEFFDFNQPLDALPDLTGLSPDVTKLLSAVNLRNPDDVLGSDTFGVGLGKNFAARFSGLLRVQTAGTYTFILGVDDGARLVIAGTPVVEADGAGEFVEGTGTIDLSAGDLPIEIEYFQRDADAEIQLSSIGPGETSGSVVSPSDLLLSPDPFSTVTDAAGMFTFPAVPTNLGDLVVSASALIDGELAFGESDPTPPLRGGVTDVGEVVLETGAVVGYYDLNLNRGSGIQVQPILTAGFEAVDVGDLRTADLGQFDILFVQNPSNGGYSSIYRNNLGKIFDWIGAGGVLIFHDRHVTTAASVLPGTPGSIFRNFTDDSNIDIVDGTTRVTDGPGGLLDNSSLDGGNSSSHGFATAGTIPPDGQGVLSTGNPANLVLYSYGFGAGGVVYSTIPLDFYLAGSGPLDVSARFRNVYAPNVIAYAQDLR